MNRYIIDKNDISKEVIEKIKKFSHTDYITIFIKGIENSEEFYKFIENFKAERFDFFCRFINVDKETTIESINQGDYIYSVDTNVNDIEVLEYYYLQQVHGFSGLNLRFNSLTELLKDGTVIDHLTKERIGNINSGLENEEYFGNDFVGLYNGKCRKCLNCLCNFSNVEKDIPIMINQGECKTKFEVYNKIPKEVKELRKEEAILLMESVHEMLKQNEFSNAVVMDKILNKKEVE